MKGSLKNLLFRRVWFLWAACFYAAFNFGLMIGGFIFGNRFLAILGFVAAAFMIRFVIWSRRKYLFDEREYFE